MVTTATLIDLASRFVLGPGEPVESAKEFPDGPAVFLETPARMLWIRSVDDWLRVARLPWVAALVVVTREDVDHAPPFSGVFLLPEAGEPIDLLDAAQVATLGSRLWDGSLGPEAFAEILVECQSPGGGPRWLVTDPADPPAGLPADAPELRSTQPLRMWDDDQGDRWLVFYAVRRDFDAAGSGLEVTLWSVRVPLDAPAIWVRRRS